MEIESKIAATGEETEEKKRNEVKNEDRRAWDDSSSLIKAIKVEEERE